MRAAFFRAHGLDPPAWEKTRPRDRARWQAIADAGLAAYTIARAELDLDI